MADKEILVLLGKKWHICSRFNCVAVHKSIHFHQVSPVVGWEWKADSSNKGLGEPNDKELKRLYKLMDGFPQLSAKDQETNFSITIELRGSLPIPLHAECLWFLILVVATLSLFRCYFRAPLELKDSKKSLYTCLVSILTQV